MPDPIREATPADAERVSRLMLCREANGLAQQIYLAFLNGDLLRAIRGQDLEPWEQLKQATPQEMQAEAFRLADQFYAAAKARIDAIEGKYPCS